MNLFRTSIYCHGNPPGSLFDLPDTVTDARNVGNAGNRAKAIRETNHGVYRNWLLQDTHRQFFLEGEPPRVVVTAREK